MTIKRRKFPLCLTSRIPARPSARPI